MICPLCGDCRSEEIAHDRRRSFIMCPTCTLVFVPEAYHLTPAEERRRYDLHDNTRRNEGYVRFLETVIEVINTVAFEGMRILDYGCGEQAVLTELLVEQGFWCDPYDPLYDHPLRKVSDGLYDLVVLCEVIEHCRNLSATLIDVRKLLASNGLVLVRTQLYPSSMDITTWWYAQDPTHINLFSREAIKTVGTHFGGSVILGTQPDIFLIKTS